MVTWGVVNRLICQTYRVTVGTFGVAVRPLVSVFTPKGVYGFVSNVLVRARRLS